MKKINLYINGDYICSSLYYHTCKEFIDRVKKDGKVVIYGSIDEETIYIKDSDKVTARFAK